MTAPRPPKPTVHFIDDYCAGYQDLFPEVSNLFGLRGWVEYGLKQSKNELGWADFRLTE
jgi:hypothetical protein